MWRQGDIFIATISDIPKTAILQPHCILAEGEATGHMHRIASNSSAQMFALGRDLYLRVIADSADVIHEEHGTITLPRGEYRVWRQREYSPEAIHVVRD